MGGTNNKNLPLIIPGAVVSDDSPTGYARWFIIKNSYCNENLLNFNKIIRTTFFVIFDIAVLNFTIIL